MATIERVTDEHSAGTLADLLNGNSRSRPIVVVTIPADQERPWIDAEEIAREVGDLARVYVMPTGAFTWEFSRRMAEGTQVYGGAGRVYPVGHGWATDLTKAPLRFAFNPEDGKRATEALTSDALRMAATAGLLHSLPTKLLREVRGTAQTSMVGRAFVEIGDTFPATVAEELTVEDVPIERVVQPGQEVHGWLDPETRRIDLTQSVRTADEALAAYEAGDVVLTKVAMVRNGKAELVLYPKTQTPAVTVAVLRKDVTTNPADDLRTLMTVGEVIPARVVSAGPDWELRLNDVDDDEPVLTAPALLPGGPPWLIAEADEPDEDEAELLAPVALAMPAVATPTEQDTRLEPVAAEPQPEPAAPRPTPAILDRSRSVTAVPPPAVATPRATATPTTQGLLLKIAGLKAHVERLQGDLDRYDAQRRAAADEREQLRYLHQQEERRANQAEHALKATRSRLRKASTLKAAPEATPPRFADAEQGFRYLVLTQWATRTLPAEQAERPLREYRIGPDFLGSLADLDGISEVKVADVVFEIVTGLAHQISGRGVHRLRTGCGGADPVRTREDGAVCWRANLQVNTPSARRIHYWVLPDGSIELARVSTHDDFDV